MCAAISIRLKFFGLIRASAAIAAAVLKPMLQRHTRIMGLLLKVNDRVLALPTAAQPIQKKKEVVSKRKCSEFRGETGVNLVGYINSESGVGEAARANIRALECSGIHFALNNLTSPSRQGDFTYTNIIQENPYVFNLVHSNADAVTSFLNEKQINYLAGKYNIAFWYWELSNFPSIWFDRFQYFHEIWVASSFCQEAISRVSPIPVVKVPPSIVINSLKQVDRPYFGIEKNAFAFLFIFDLFSYVERKNPFAVIDAFRRAFQGRDDVLLVLKFSNPEWNKEGRQQIAEAIKGLNVKLIDGYLDKDEVHALMNLSDCYVSLHRSEGFGLPLAEAMYLGKPVIATGYSSNTDFMTVNNSFLVKYDLVKIEKDIGPYKKGNVWAEPDTGHAAELMRLVFENRELARRTGERAAADIRKNLSPEATGRVIKERLQRIMEEKGIS